VSLLLVSSPVSLLLVLLVPGAVEASLSVLPRVVPSVPGSTGWVLLSVSTGSSVVAVELGSSLVGAPEVVTITSLAPLLAISVAVTGSTAG